MEDEQKVKFISGIAKMMEQDMEGLIYEKPKCDFEHIWNCAVDSCKQVLETYQEDVFLALNNDRLDEFIIKDKEDKTKP